MLRRSPATPVPRLSLFKRQEPELTFRQIQPAASAIM